MTRFVQLLPDLSSGLLQQITVLVIYVDFIKAFDPLWHSGSLYKLHQASCPHQLLTFVIEYLEKRTCFLEMSDIKSPIIALEKYVPQGSCLGPILFLLYHHSLAESMLSATYKHLYADDLAFVFIASP